MKMPADRVLVLDGYRGLTILTVMVFHYMTHWTFLQDVDNHLSAASVFSVVRAFSYGWIGVALFFMTSAFVIYFTLLKSKGVLDFVFRHSGSKCPSFARAPADKDDLCVS